MRIELFRDKTGQWRWRMKADNNKRLGGPQEGFNNKGDCIRNAEQVTDASARGIPIMEEQ